jgi:integrase
MELRDEKRRKKLGVKGEQDAREAAARQRVSERVSELETAALEQGTHKTYMSGVRSWTAFATERGFSGESVPDEDTLCEFVAWMSEEGKGKEQKGMEVATVGVYLAAVRDFFLKKGAGCVLEGKKRLQRVVRGWKKMKGGNTDTRRAVTVAMLHEASELVDWNNHDAVLAWLNVVWGVLGLFRLGELLPAARSDSKHVKVQVRDVQWNEGAGEMSVFLRSSKTDTFKRGVTIAMQKVWGREKVCPGGVWKRVEALRRGKDRRDDEAMMRKEDGTMLTKREVVEMMGVWFGEADRRRGIVTQEKLSGHSLRKGGATSLLLRGVSESLVQALGRWKSDAYKSYAVLNKTLLREAQRAMMRTEESDLAVGGTRWAIGQWVQEDVQW